MILKGYIFGVLYALLCLLIAFFVYKIGVPKKYTRKLVHILVGAEWIILSHYMGATYHFLIVCLFFLLLLAIAHFKNLMPMISSDSDNAPGTVYYALAMSVMATVCLFIPDMMLPFGIGVLCTSVGDGLAGVVGSFVKKHNPKVYKNKTLFGFVANLLASCAVAITFKYIALNELKIWHCIMIGLLSAGLELITVFGLDNVSITVGVSFLAYAFVNYSTIDSYAIPIVITPYIIALVLEKKVLTPNGLILALILDVVISLTLANFGFVLLLSFLVISVAIDKVKKHSKKEDTITKKGDCRDGVQVIANGLIPMMMALMFSGTGNPAFIVGFIAALAEATADTAASGIGAYARNVFDLFRMRKTQPGLSGGMSFIGTLASLFGAAAISTIALAFGVINLQLLILISLCAFLGAVFDSMLGSLIQVKYKCRVCETITEREYHCEKRTEKYSGFAFFDNDVVNLLSGLFSAIFAAVLFSVI